MIKYSNEFDPNLAYVYDTKSKIANKKVKLDAINWKAMWYWKQYNRESENATWKMWQNICTS